jgi:hypothetical protein
MNYYYNNCITLILIRTTDINNLLIIKQKHTQRYNTYYYKNLETK